ncbi:MAG: myo-inositol-1(or 4)-monophosphatase [Candidatus Saganbacteria bacterium]|uniref:Inositol-1-monophosphatase n=1 Tax=Candidatus Saganbacteria bacterium TaxID=2575572 RepID=A0A833L2H7_UNCSA|nr:MAG: myo-inositol-1(or 4)-monophosphatase [Candidatus Saganbacteria bacterium]
MKDDNQALDIAINAAKTAGEILKANFKKDYRIIRKSPKEMVSEVDMKSQEVICAILGRGFPSCGIITEEKRFSNVKGDKNWIIDPIDGTHNYIAGLPFSGISIALMEGDRFDLGVIYFPMENELYYAVRGQGAFCNGEPISVSDNGVLSKAIVNYDNQFHLSENSFKYYKTLTERAFTTRILGVATRDLCFIASGKIDGRVWNATKICDIAAGIVILTEAGGELTDFSGHPCGMNSKQVVASNSKIHGELLAIFKGEKL